MIGIVVLEGVSIAKIIRNIGKTTSTAVGRLSGVEKENNVTKMNN